MKIKNNTILFVFALSTLASTLGSCRSEDDVLNGLPQGSVPLVLGDVTVAGAQTVNNRATGGNARAAISENASGYTGIRKSRFVDGDVLNLTLSNGSGGSSGSGSGGSTSVTATLTGGKWVLAPAKVFITPGVTEVSATHTATEQTTGIATDDLAAAHADCVLTAATGKLAISMKHAGAMIDITPGATDGATITSVTVNTDVPTVAEEESVTGGSGTATHYRTLTAATTVVNSISAVIGGTTYTATLATPITVAANKRYPVTLTFKHQTLTATPSAPQDWTNGGTVPVPGYTRIIDSPEALAQLAQDVNGGSDDDLIAIAIQVADLDLGQLKPADEAGTNPLTGAAYTYTATADNWVSIGKEARPFQGQYNGNGHTISNLKSGDCGLFGYAKNACLTGIHLRNVNLTGSYTGGLAGIIMDKSYVTLCSVTGSITYNGSNNVMAGGLIGNTATVGLEVPCITRCSADVDINIEGFSSGYVGGFIGYLGYGCVAGCMATGDIKNQGGNLPTGGFAGEVQAQTKMDYCMATGNVTGSKSGAFIGKFNSGSSVISCYATGTVTGTTADFINDAPSNGSGGEACAYTGSVTMDNSLSGGITGDVAVADLYNSVIHNNYSLADVKTLHWSAAEGYTLTEVTRTWYATDVWKDNGAAAPTLDMSYEGWDGKYEGQEPRELAVSGQPKYWIAPVNATNADGQEKMPWADIAGVCPKGWHVPTRDELDTMFGANITGLNVSNIFGDHTVYWTTTEVPGETDKAYYFVADSSGNIMTVDEDTTVKRSQAKDITDTKVRCVRAQ